MGETLWYFNVAFTDYLHSFICMGTDNSPQLTGKIAHDSTLGEIRGEGGDEPVKTIPKLALNHKELIEKIKKEKEKFIQEKKSQEHAEKQAKIEKLVNSSKVDDTGAKGITGGEPSDEIAKERRNFVKRVG